MNSMMSCVARRARRRGTSCMRSCTRRAACISGLGHTKTFCRPRRRTIRRITSSALKPSLGSRIEKQLGSSRRNTRLIRLERSALGSSKTTSRSLTNPTRASLISVKSQSRRSLSVALGRRMGGSMSWMLLCLRRGLIRFRVGLR